MGTYSFKDINATISGPGGSVPLANGSESAEEGITITMTDDKNTMVIGADGAGMHNLHAGKSGSVTVRLLKTSPVNAILSQMYDVQTVSSLLHGKNVITVNDVARGDVIAARQAAFKRFPSVSYGKDGAMMEWEFDAVFVDGLLGSGNPAV